jgi:hypothetical protein
VRPHWCSVSRIRNVTIQGELTWHWHPGTGEFVLVPGGQLTIQMTDRNLVLAPRELFLVPAVPGTVRRPIPKPRRLPFEPGTIINTGDADGEPTAQVEELA